MPAKTKATKNIKRSTSVKAAKSNVAKASGKASLLNKKVKFNWKIAAVIGVVLVAALGYLFVRLSSAGGADITAFEMSTSGGATREAKGGGMYKINGSGFAVRTMASNHKSYPKSWDKDTVYRVTYYNANGGNIKTNNAGLYLRCDTDGKTVNETKGVVLGAGESLSVRASWSDITRVCGNAKPVVLRIGIPTGFYITGVAVSHPGAASSTPSPVSSPVATRTPSPQLNCATMSNGQGNQNGCVTMIQQRLKNLGYDPGPVDGIYGTKTTSAVKVFQSRSGLTQDGVVGPKTWAALTNPNAARKQ